jgi:CcmD family protein
MNVNLLKRRIHTLVVALAAAALLPATALAQVYEKVEGIPRQEIPAGRFVSAAYGFIWIAVLVYVVVIARGIARVNRELAELRRKLDGAGTPSRG